MTNILRDAYNACFFQTPLETDDDKRVEFHRLGVRGTDFDPIIRLQTGILNADSPTQQLFSGFIGSGKSTELKRLTANLEAEGYTALLIDTEEYMNLKVPPNVNDLLATAAAGVDTFIQTKRSNKSIRGFKSYWERFHNFLGSEIVLEGVKIPVPAACELELKLKQEVSFKAKLYAYLEQNGRLSDLARQCNTFLDEAVALLKKSFPKNRGLVIILDSFEKVRGDQRNADQIRSAVETIFVRDWQWLRLPCHVVYTVPSWLTFFEFGAAAEFGRVCILPMCRLTDQKTGKPVEEGVAAMRSMLEKRMDMKAVFSSPQPLDVLIQSSGGYPRDLLRMMREVFLSAMMEKIAPPISENALNRLIETVIRDQIAVYEKPVYDEDVPLLVAVAQTHDVPRKRRDEAFRLAELFDNHFVLGYRNGVEWYDLHPLVRRSAKIQQALKEANGKGKKRS